MQLAGRGGSDVNNTHENKGRFDRCCERADRSGEATGAGWPKAGGDGKLWSPRFAHPHPRPTTLLGEDAVIMRAWIMQPVEPRTCGVS